MVLLSAIAIIVADQAGKLLAGTGLPRAALPLLTAWQVLVVGAIGAAAYLLGWRRNKLLTFTSLALICSGSTSNLFDRLFRGRVFVYLPWTDGRKINLADVAITSGTLLGFVLVAIWLFTWLRRRRVNPSRTSV